MSDLDLNYAALLAIILNAKLSRTDALTMMGIPENREMKNDICNPNQKINESEKDKINFLYNIKGLNTREIAEIYNVSQRTINYYMHKYNIESRSRGRTPTTTRRVQG